MLERLQFSLPLTTIIAAPVDLVWDVVKDIPSYPSIYSSCVSVERQPDTNTVSKGGGADKSSSSTNNNKLSVSKDPLEERPAKLLGSRWKFTRISVFENQTYGAPATITQVSVTDTSRVIVLSTYEMLGSTCSLKMSVEKVDASLSNDASSRSVRGSGTNSERRDSVNSTASSTKQQLFEKEEACQLTVSMTMIPYQFFVKLLGIMCCLCLLKWRARIAMECDLEDITSYCEEKYKERLNAEKVEEG
eukprot:CAMPEP_0201690332 /NCGR_PEP_ID=MMETSP0578-20130828/3790_1 /ASSEMBLY_ACC=CAM_ASM_000663 /TAXON_ID=267565 /ORGANISM="Skeletonema grethea, Strain CCMP 1804" /LENGTH=246 /DNA_ID=CAMNT_0048175283 /DNA_START=291 /DNA_END=1027 /DNA_ORIENTATION=+